MNEERRKEGKKEERKEGRKEERKKHKTKPTITKLTSFCPCLCG